MLCNWNYYTHLDSNKLIRDSSKLSKYSSLEILADLICFKLGLTRRSKPRSLNSDFLNASRDFLLNLFRATALPNFLEAAIPSLEGSSLLALFLK